MKKFILLSILALACVQAWSCGGWVRPHYYMFSVFNRDLMNNTIQDDALNYWVKYTGEDGANWQARNLGYIDPAEFDKSDNLLIQTARQRNDVETLNYLRVLNKYVANNGADDNEWNYPTKEQLEARKVAVEEVRRIAMAYSGNKYKDQYALLLMRCNMTLKDHEANVAYWNNTASKLKESVYKTWMKDIYAGALLNTGKKDKASEIYAELGDMTSIKYCVREKRNLEGIKDEYAQNPNSPTLVFLVQDFVNNMQETLDNGSDRELMKYVEATGIYGDDVKGFVDFAGKVLAEGKTKSPAMWEAARGFVNYMAGNQSDAIKQLTNAKSLDGTQRMKDNARACLMLASIKSAQPNDAFFNYMLGEYKWLDKVAGVDENSSMADDRHYNDVFERVTYDALVPQLEQWNKTDMMLAVLGMAAKHPDFGGEFGAKIEEATSAQFNHYNDYLKGGNHNAFEQWAISKNNIDIDQYNDLMGTKLLREGEFDKAIPYLGKVPLSYISNQGISYYMARKDYNQEPWMKRQFLSPWKESDTQVKSNAKLQYCRDMVALDKQLASASGEKKWQLAYRKAALLYQASYKGDCWYLTRYASSVYDNAEPYEYDFVGESAKLLAQVVKGTKDKDLKLKTLFAQTFMTGELEGYCVKQEYDWKSNSYSYTLDRSLSHYNDMRQLISYASTIGGMNKPFISKCDIIKKFRRLNTKS